MIFFAMLGFCASVFLPWWVVLPWAFAMGFLLPRGLNGALQTGTAAFIVWFVAAYYRNGHAHGVIAPKIAALFHLPDPLLIFVFTGALAFVLVMPAYWFGDRLKVLLKD
jgi:hypothetical protein